MDDVLASVDVAAAAVTGALEKIGAEQPALPSPCAEWDVRGVLNHLVMGT